MFMIVFIFSCINVISFKLSHTHLIACYVNNLIRLLYKSSLAYKRSTSRYEFASESSKHQFQTSNHTQRNFSEILLNQHEIGKW